MLSEDGLLLVLVLAACALVVLGTLDLVWPTRKPAAARGPSRRLTSRLAPATRAARTMGQPGLETRVAPARRPRVPRLAPSSPQPAHVAPTPGASDALSEEPPAVAAASEPSDRPEPEISIVERGFALLKAERLDEVVTLGREALKARKSEGTSVPTVAAAQEAARLWGLVGLAKQGLDDLEGARFALEEAIALAPGSERSTWERHLVALVLAVGRRSLGGAGMEPTVERVASLTSAIEWLERGLAISPDDAELRDAVTAARQAVWPAHEALVDELTARREVAEARRVLEDVIGDPECPPEHRAAFRRRLERLSAGAPGAQDAAVDSEA